MYKSHQNARFSPPNILTYGDVIHASNIDSLFGKSNSAILYYPLHRVGPRAEEGHYVALIRHPDSIHFYDPYGVTIDGIKKHSGGRAEMYKEDENTLVRLLLKFYSKGKYVDYSHHKHQSENPWIATCGRHSLTRCLRPDLTNDQYNVLIRKMCKVSGLTPDELVVKLWPPE